MYTFLYILNTWNCIYLKMIKMENFILHIFFTTIKKTIHIHTQTHILYIHTYKYLYIRIFIYFLKI